MCAVYRFQQQQQNMTKILGVDLAKLSGGEIALIALGLIVFVAFVRVAIMQGVEDAAFRRRRREGREGRLSRRLDERNLVIGPDSWHTGKYVKAAGLDLR